MTLHGGPPRRQKLCCLFVSGARASRFLRGSGNLLYGTERPGYDTLGNPHRSSRLPGGRVISGSMNKNNRRLSIYGTSCAPMKPDNEFVHYRSVILK